jgi:membrane-bound lytic murein transglycosylase MltF
MLLAGVVLLGIEHSSAQVTRPQDISANDPFSSFHAALSSAADKTLAAPSQGSIAASRADSSLPGPDLAIANASTPGRAINRVQQLRPVIEPILREERVPTELAAVVLVESGGQQNALSPKGARGLWQFMPDTARRYGLAVSRDRDERLDIQRSTRAAARYLRDLHQQFGDWQLAFAAYNAGGDLVQRAIERKHTSDFTLLSSQGALPLETRRYVPAVIDAMQKVSNTSGFVAPPRNARLAWIVYAGTKNDNESGEILRETKGELK